MASSLLSSLRKRAPFFFLAVSQYTSSHDYRGRRTAPLCRAARFLRSHFCRYCPPSALAESTSLSGACALPAGRPTRHLCPCCAVAWLGWVAFAPAPCRMPIIGLDMQTRHARKTSCFSSTSKRSAPFNHHVVVCGARSFSITRTFPIFMEKDKDVLKDAKIIAMAGRHAPVLAIERRPRGKDGD